MARFSAPVQTGPETHPASCKMGTGSFPRVESDRGVTLTPSPPSSAEVEKQIRAIPLVSLRAFVTYEKGETCLQSWSLLGLKTWRMIKIALYKIDANGLSTVHIWECEILSSYFLGRDPVQSALMMQSSESSEISVYFYQSKQRHIP
jgi:hypothetical protein